MQQTKHEIENWYQTTDPWEYQIKHDDIYRKQQILDFLPQTYDRVLDIGCGEGWITQDLPGKELHGIEWSDTAASRFPSNVNRVLAPEGKYDLVTTQGTLYTQYNHKQIAEWIKDSSTKHILVCGIEDWLLPYSFGTVIKETKFPYRDWHQLFKLYEVNQ